MAYMDTGLKNSLPSMKDWLSKWIHAYKKQIYSNGWQKERPPGSKKTPQQLQTHNVPIDDVEITAGTN